jgi:hypothetical protein
VNAPLLIRYYQSEFRKPVYGIRIQCERSISLSLYVYGTPYLCFRSTRSTILDLLLLHARGWDQTPPKSLGRQDSWAEYDAPCSFGVQCSLLVDNSKNIPEAGDLDVKAEKSAPGE